MTNSDSFLLCDLASLRFNNFMSTIEQRVYARAALAGNPSDVYYGKTLSLSLQDFSARVVLTPSEKLEIVPNEDDFTRYKSIHDLSNDIRRNGYYGGLRLVKAAVKKFADYCQAHDIELSKDRNFSICYETDIPRQVGLAGSSAIITATWRALMAHYRVLVPREILPNWVRATEQEELGITGGLQDRVAQSYGGLVFMDFNRETIERNGFGHYEPLDVALLPPLYLAYATRFAEESGVVHNDLRARWESGDENVRQVMQKLAHIAQNARNCLVEGRAHELGALINRNFELRRAIVPISSSHLQMVEIAQSCGASAHFAGSGGAIIGTFESAEMFTQLEEKLSEQGCRVLEPRIAPLYQ